MSKIETSYAEIVRREAEGTISPTLRREWTVLNPETGDPVEAAKRVLRIRRRLTIVITLLIVITTVSAVTCYIAATSEIALANLTIEPLVCFIVCGLAALVTWPINSIRRSVRAPGVQIFLNGHDTVWGDLVKQKVRDNSNVLKGEAARVLKEQGDLIDKFERELRPELEINIERDTMNLLYDRYREFNLVPAGGPGRYFPPKTKKLAKVVTPAKTAEPTPAHQTELAAQGH